MSDPAAIPKPESLDPAMTGRDRRPSSCSPLTDTDRLNFLVQHTHCDFWVHHPNYGAQGKPFSCEGVVIREVIDGAIKWHSANNELSRPREARKDDA